MKTYSVGHNYEWVFWTILACCGAIAVVYMISLC